jgi:uncharacterized membrane protein
MVRLRKTFGVASAFGLSLLFASPAAAGEGEISFCNNFPHTVHIAIAYLQTDVNNHLSRGWLNVGTGKCYVFDTAIRVQTFSYRAESDPYKEGKDKVKMNWGKGQQFAIRDGSFQIYGAEKAPSGAKLVEFSKGPVSTGAPLTAIVTFNEDGTSTTTVPAPSKGGGERSGPSAPPTNDKSPSEGSKD